MAGSPQEATLQAFAGRRAFGFHTDHAELQLALASAGAGVAMLPDFLAETPAGLVSVRPDDPPLLRPVWLVVHSDLKASPRIRAVLDCLGKD